MGIRGKFNLILTVVFLVGYAGSLWLVQRVLQENARQEVLHNAGIMMEAALAIRKYTVNEIRPLLKAQLTREFLPQTVPAYAATQNFETLRTKYPNYSYKEATLNPTNPRDRATDWEADLIRWFHDRPDEKELQGIRQTPIGPSLYVSRPIRITNPACLICHSTPEAAPASLVDKYGSSNGFGWNLNEVVGAQVVSVPMSLPLERAKNTLIWFAGVLGGVFLTLLVASNIVLQMVVIGPVKAMASNANEISMGAMETPELSVSSKDEIGTLARAFNRMHRSLGNAMKLLDQQKDKS
jgi:protein-histidine pros-kinase